MYSYDKQPEKERDGNNVGVAELGGGVSWALKHVWFISPLWGRRSHLLHQSFNV